MAKSLKIEQDKTTVIVVYETLRQSVLADCATFVMLAGLCSYGVWLNSFIIELIGGIMFMIFMVGRVQLLLGGDATRGVTVEQAVTALREWQEEIK
jgi:uncharacterized membrane protein